MRAVTIRYNKKNGAGRPTERFLEEFCESIVFKLRNNGFITEASLVNSSSIKIGLHMSSFRVDTAKLGHNARVGRQTHLCAYFKSDSPKGYKRTDVPTWEQRVQFNDIVNDMFDAYGLMATIRSGAYVVRTRDGRRAEWDWAHEGDSSGNWSCDAQRDIIMSEAEARELLDSDRLEAEHKVKQRLQRKLARQGGLRLVAS